MLFAFLLLNFDDFYLPLIYYLLLLKPMFDLQNSLKSLQISTQKIKEKIKKSKSHPTQKKKKKEEEANSSSSKLRLESKSPDLDPKINFTLRFISRSH